MTAEESTASSTMVLSGDNLVHSVQRWIHTDGRACLTMADMIRGFAATLRSHGISVYRVFLGTAVIHPQAAAWVWKWEYPDIEMQASRSKSFWAQRFELLENDAPFLQLESKNTVRIRHTDEHIPQDCRYMFEKEGYTDMYALRYVVRGEFGGGISWATKNSEGFSDDNIAFFDAIMPALSTVIQLQLTDLCMDSLLRAYLGNDPGARVHRGSISRGDGMTIRSVVWFSDIRGFTQLSGMLDRDTVIAFINEVFEITENVLSSKGGEVLKFMGDGLMGVFTAAEGDEGDKSCLCKQAREAAADLQTKLSELRAKRSERGLPGANVGIGLHYGDVSYGNIGAPNRLDFTVIGPSVNLASRIEGLCSKLHVSVLASEEFVKRDIKRDAWKSCGEHSLKGVAEAVEVFELADGTIES